MMIRSTFLIFCVLLVLPGVAAAFSLVSQPDPFELGSWNDITATQTQYGELEGWPHTFVFAVASTTTLRLQAAVGTDAPPVSLLVVREADRGVREVARQTDKETIYEKTTDSRYGIRLNTAPAVEVELTSGLYRAEVSSPDNTGVYQLTVGTKPTTAGYWQTVKDTFKVHAFYGSWLTALFTWRVMLLWVGGLGAWYWLRRRRNLKKHA